jgi:CTP synthase (UTP-ammonia lyase)
MKIFSDFQTSVRKAFDEIDPNWESYNGIVICGTHTPKIEEVERLLGEIKNARDTKTPFLGICFGHQLCAIEYARNILGIKDATSEELGEGTHVVKKSGALKVGLHEGESYWNNYEVAIDVKKPDFFLTTQSHPEYQSSIDRPHPLLVQFLALCRNQ